jgi:hypothetical protein
MKYKVGDIIKDKHYDLFYEVIEVNLKLSYRCKNIKSGRLTKEEPFGMVESWTEKIGTLENLETIKILFF